MDSGTHKLLESATHRTLHANNFSRCSSQASLALTDLLARYLSLLSTTCAKYAQHAGRAGLTARDAFCALEELGVTIEELKEYCALEGNELGRYTVHSMRRVDDLNELKAHLSDGLRQDRDDAIPLHYGLVTAPPPEESDEGEYEDEVEAEVTGVEAEDSMANDMDVDVPQHQEASWEGRKPDPPDIRRPLTPILPLSPISNPSSPTRKRPRTSNWKPPSHIPDFLPPFPTNSPLPIDIPHSPHVQQMQPPPARTETSKIDKPPSPLSQPLTSTSASDYLVQVPYSQSSLSAIPEWHLPLAPSLPPPLQTRLSRLSTPQTEPALIAAYHHILTHPHPPNSNSANPSRHKVAMVLLSQTQTCPRWEPPDTLYSSIAPCQPRVAPVGPTFPVPLGETPPLDSRVKHDGDGKDFKFPPAQPRPVSTNERLTPLISQQPSRIPDLAHHVLPPAILTRTSRLTHPPVLHRGTKQLVYGSGTPAPWNASATPLADAIPPTPIIGKSKEINGLANGKVKEPPAKVTLPDARLYATWDYEQKSFKAPLAPAPRARGRMGSLQGGGGVVPLGLAGGRSGNKVG